MDKVVASAAEAVADIPDGSSSAVGGFGLCGIPSVLIRRCRTRWASRTCAWCRTTAASTAGASVSCSASGGSPDDVELCGREQGVRAPVPLRRARGRAGAAGHARRAAARRRCRHPGVLHAGRRRHPGRRRRPALALRRRRLGRAGVARQGDPRASAAATYVLEEAIRHRLRPRARLEAATGTATSSSTRAPATSTRSCATAGRDDDRRGRGARRARRARPRPRPHAGHLRAAGGCSWTRRSGSRSASSDERRARRRMA